MARRNVWVNDETGQVDRIRSITVEVFRDGDSFSLFIKKRLVSSGKDLEEVLHPMKNPELRQRIVSAFLAQDTPLDHLRQEFHGYRIEHGWPEKERGVVYG